MLLNVSWDNISAMSVRIKFCMMSVGISCHMMSAGISCHIMSVGIIKGFAHCEKFHSY